MWTDRRCQIKVGLHDQRAADGRDRLESMQKRRRNHGWLRHRAHDSISVFVIDACDQCGAIRFETEMQPWIGAINLSP